MMTISIHALLAESDAIGKYSQYAVTGISIHALLAESDRRTYPVRVNGRVFLSTLSLRRATKYIYLWYTILVNFYPRSPCGERPQIYIRDTALLSTFLSTLSLRRATFFDTMQIVIVVIFLSTLSLRRATGLVRS